MQNKGHGPGICRVGYTRDLARREREWKAEPPNLRNFIQCGGPYDTQDEAEDAEQAYSNRNGCDYNSGGRPAKGPFYLYHFYYE